MKNILIFVFLIIYFSGNSQSKTEIAAYNVGLGAVGGGLGAMINKKPDEKLGKVFLKGFWQGAVGGYLIYESKNIVGRIPEKENWTYSWGAKLVNAAGTSIVENAASNRELWEQWHLNIGFNRIEFYTKDKFKIRYKILPVSFILTGITAIKSKFELERSLQTGVLVFSRQDISTEFNARGAALGNIIIFDDTELENFEVMGHELIHVYQYYDYNFINAYGNPLFQKWEKKSATFKNIKSILHIDFHAGVVRALYYLEGGRNNDYHLDNFYEYEAEFFATGGNVRL